LLGRDLTDAFAAHYPGRDPNLGSAAGSRPPRPVDEFNPGAERIGGSRRPNHSGFGIDPRRQSMKLALLAVLGAILGALGGGAIGIVVGIAWVEIFKTVDSEAVLVFFTFMPIGAIVGAAGGAILFGVFAARDVEIPISREPAGGRDP
jgi:hypothetical protein